MYVPYDSDFYFLGPEYSWMTIFCKESMYSVGVTSSEHTGRLAPANLHYLIMWKTTPVLLKRVPTQIFTSQMLAYILTYGQ